ncbi:tetratricopeptide repeat protein [Mesonia aquimarina]|uniref:tetratricopeptide repeat protein n=1 Tax=Mesonia aquimarina TaxID=1504967 RepID=UPI000EF56E2A|nr:hypothetical protein [Mesonia aquimarina]
MKFLFVFFLIPMFVLGQTNFEEGKKSFEKRDLDQAKEYFLAVEESSENKEKAKEYIADIAVLEKDWDTALSIYENLLEKKPENANLNFKYGGTLGLKAKVISKFEAAFYISDIKKHIKKAAKLDESHLESRWALVQLYIQLPGFLGGSFDTADNYADQILAIDSLNGNFAKAFVAEAEENTALAKQYYLKAIQFTNPENCKEKLEKFPMHKIVELAGKEISGCVNFNRNQLNYLTAKASAEYNVQNERGLLYLQRYIDDFSSIDGVPLHVAYFRKAQLYRNLNNKNQAKNWIEKSLAIEDDFKKAQEEKALILAM